MRNGPISTKAQVRRDYETVIYLDFTHQKSLMVFSILSVSSRISDTACGSSPNVDFYVNVSIDKHNVHMHKSDATSKHASVPCEN